MTNTIKNVFVEFWTNTKLYFTVQKDEGPKNLKQYFSDWSLWEKCWIGIATIAIVLASIWTWDPTNLMGSSAALISSITGIWCVLLVAKGKISNYIWGLVNVILYAYAAYTWGLFGDFTLNAFIFLPMQFIGWHFWVKPKNKKSADDVKVKFLSTKGRIIWAAISVVAVVAYGFILKLNPAQLTPFFDSTSTVLSIIAVVLMAKLFMEQWVLWIIVDVVTVIMWANIVFFQESGLYNIGILIMWIAFLTNAIFGLYNWIKMNKEQE